MMQERFILFAAGFAGAGELVLMAAVLVVFALR